jgi:hypothetical protein
MEKAFSEQGEQKRWSKALCGEEGKRKSWG